MIRFLLNFFLFGILYFLIYTFFPDAFSTLVEWAGKVYSAAIEWGQVAANWASEMIKGAK
ncbi:hypothetical protein [Estrella lausannensis]|uniref:Putative membrane protein n=1 Tax=Estrella lausannensis TaxID=483423 RepID=A0A0H5DR23_9BACT|nr:hypothetical protein [Estrella lausannensis]CRX39121.1 putative membrane protein [Estrella lausannensis]